MTWYTYELYDIYVYSNYVLHIPIFERRDRSNLSLWVSKAVLISSITRLESNLLFNNRRKSDIINVSAVSVDVLWRMHFNIHSLLSTGMNY